MASEQTIELTNVGPIEHVSIPVAAGGGITVLRGRNGRGKTKALEAIDSAISGRGKPEVRDGALRGEVTAFGVSLRVGRATRRSGELEVHSLEGRLSVAELVDPGLKSPEAADARRIKALVQLSGTAPSVELFYHLLGGRDEFEALASPSTIGSDDLVAMAERLKRCIEAEARKVEGQAEHERGRAAGARESAAGIDMGCECDPAQLGEGLERAIAEQSALERQQRIALEAAKHWEAAKVRLDEAEASYDGPTATEADEARANATTRFQETEAVVKELEERLRAARVDFDQSRAALAAAIQTHKTAASHELLIATCREELTAAQPAPPKAEDIELAGRRVSECRVAVERGALVRRAKEQLASAEVHERAAEEFTQRAAFLRHAALGTDEVLSEVVAASGCPLRVEEGRLVLTTGRGATYFGELSQGERWKLSLDIAIDAVGAGGVLTIPQEAWESLDPIARREIGEHVAGRGVVVLTAEASGDDEIRAEVF